jgi:hypothetical protein
LNGIIFLGSFSDYKSKKVEQVLNNKSITAY